MKRLFLGTSLVLLLGPCHPAPVRAQGEIDRGPLPRFPKGWITVGGDVGLAGGSGYNSTITAGGRATVGWRFAHRWALEAEGLRATAVGNGNNNPPSCATSGTIVCTSTGIDNVGTFSGGSLSLSYVRGSYGTSSMLISLGAGAFHMAGQFAPSTTAFGVHAAIEQTLVEAARGSITGRLGADVVPSAHAGTFWNVPLGIGARFW